MILRSINAWSVISRSRFRKNTATNGGAIYGSDIIVSDCTFDLVNLATENGGCIYHMSGSAVVTRSTFVLSTALNSGGVIYTRVRDWRPILAAHSLSHQFDCEKCREN